MTGRIAWRCLLALAGFALALLGTGARADTPVALYKSFAGYVNFTGTEATMRTGTTNVCAVVSSTTTLQKSLAGIPSGATVVSAHLYWAGSGTTADTTVTFEGQTITAGRTYAAAYTTGGVTYDYFSAAADVTSIVKAKGNGTYSFSGLTVSTGTPWCAVEGVLGGFALLVVYEDPATQPFRVLNLYEGFQYTRNSSLTLSLSNFRIPNPLGTATGRIGHITWEGDDALSASGEDLTFNGNSMTDSLNPAGNQFNSKSNIDGDTASYGIDFDAYTVGSPIIQADQTTATTVYSSGQDLVLLNAEIVAVPNVPTDDLALTMTRSGQTIPGQNVSYSLVVQNNGPNDEIGPVTVTDTLPPGETYVSASGTGWVCSVSGAVGAQVVKCTRAGSLPKNTTAATITLTVGVSSTGTGTYTNSATVAGQIFDNVGSNNTATDTATDPTILVGAGMALTDKVCVDGAAISTDPNDTVACHRVTWVYANNPTDMYITRLDLVTGKAKSFGNGNTNYSPKLALSCVNPTTAGTTAQATFGGVSLVAGCLSNGAVPLSNASNTWSPAATLKAAGGSPTAVLKSTGGATQFQFADVGLLQLNFTDTDGTTVRKARFVSVPDKLTIAVKRTVDNVPNPGSSAGVGFVRAGEQFTVTVGALMKPVGTSAALPAPSFGRESPPAAIGLMQSAINQAPATVPAVVGTFTSQGNGTYVGNFTYNEVGDLRLTAVMASPLNDYLGSGVYVGFDKNAASPSPPTGQFADVGRFYPRYFSTEVTKKFDCLVRMACPSGTLAGGQPISVSGAAYSGQAFKVAVTPHAVDGTTLTNYAKIYASTITLNAIAQAGSTTAATGGTLFPASGTGAVTIPADTLAPGAELSTLPNFQLTTPYISTTPRNVAWSVPLPVYFSATASQARTTGPGTSTADDIKSYRGGAVTAEGGIMILNGRLQVANAHGSELLRLPVQIGAQYWTGKAWEFNSSDSVSPIDATLTTFSNCKSIPCASSSVLSTSVTLATGLGTVWFKAPQVAGSATVKMTGAPAYLPSTLGQITFGVYRSPLVYIREVY